MAILKQRLARKNDSGVYEPVHLETSSDVVLRTDGSTTAEATLSSFDSHAGNSTVHITAAERTAWNNKTSNTGTITEIKMNGTSIGTSGSVDLGTVLTSHQDISDKVTGPSSSTDAGLAAFNGTTGKTIK